MPFPRRAALLALFLASCSNATQPPRPVRSTSHAIFNGQPDNKPEHAAVVALANSSDGFFCSGTLIAPRVVLTAAHCVALVSQAGLRVGFGADIRGSAMQWVDAVESLAHPGFNTQTLANDIAVIRLGAPAPANVVPIPPLPPSLALHPAGAVGVSVEFVGFGNTEYHGFGTRLTVNDAIDLVCENSSGCLYAGELVPAGTFCYDQQPGGPCNGDSGGPAFLVKDGKEYVAGVTSFGDEYCTVYGCSAKADAYEDFIKAFVGTIGPKNDGEACTAGSECQSGFCADGFCCNERCDGGCTACSVAKGSAANGQCHPIQAPCDDGDLCTVDDACAFRTCIGTPTVCPDPAACHERATCNPATGQCGAEPTLADATPCDDGSQCTVEDACLAGACVGTARAVCAPPRACLQSSACVDGKCGEFLPVADGQGCDDENLCTYADACTAGMCKGNPVVCPSEACHAPARCDRSDGICKAGAAHPDGRACDDGNACTTGTTCVSGACVGTVASVTCAPLDECHAAGTCDPSAGCSNPALPDGTRCSLGECQGGVCQESGCGCSSGSEPLSLALALLALGLPLRRGSPRRRPGRSTRP